ncbi:hypothetical protein [Alcanivorax sp.]|uniref:hypothetical protein n=1 Tax=Alcanivorax sp. TaxID=1872427 RepID=UPI0025BC1CA6|nr:hypothetical protein [Alcanivorax sp.]
MSEDQIKNIENRPKELENLPFYKNLPLMPIRIDVEGAIGDFLNYDIFQLDGVQPLEKRHVEANNGLIGVNASQESIEIYKKERVNFQLIYVVINAYGFRDENGELVGKPYRISLMPASKRGAISSVPPEWVENIDLERMGGVPKLYKGFNPFRGAFGLHMLGMHDYSDIESDMLGFVHSVYALADKFEHSEVLLPGIPKLQGHGQVLKDYKKYRNNWYFKSFRKLKPKKIWGCDSPIELFLLHAMDSIGLNPELQTIICEDGFTVPGFHKLWENLKSRKRLKSITDADFYFPDKRLAVFCDSVAHHSSPEAKKKDREIDEKLNKIGIQSLRICGTDIARSPMESARIVESELRNQYKDLVR